MAGMAPPTKYPGTMTARQFDKAAKRANTTPMKLARARRVLVDGESAREVADSDGVIVTTVYRAISEVHSQYNPMAGYWPSLSPMMPSRRE